MLPFLNFLAPIGITFVKKMGFAFVKKMVSNTIADYAADYAKNKIEVYLKNLFTEFCTNAIINVAALSFCIYAGPFFFDSEVVRFLVCSVYLSSILQALWKFSFTYFPPIWLLVIVYRVNLKKMILDRYIDKLGLLEYIGIAFHLISPQQERVNRVNRILWAIVGFVLKHGLAIVIYIGIFQFIVAPWAVEDATGLNWYEAAIYPFLMAIDYFFPVETQNIFIPID